jgi:hypothetical protein
VHSFPNMIGKCSNLPWLVRLAFLVAALFFVSPLVVAVGLFSGIPFLFYGSIALVVVICVFGLYLVVARTQADPKV